MTPIRMFRVAGMPVFQARLWGIFLQSPAFICGSAGRQL
jgi:hypothetical protein